MSQEYRPLWGRIIVFWVLWAVLMVGVTMLLSGCEVATAAEWSDLGVVHKTLISEAGGEKDRIRAMQAVGNVIRRRAELRGMTVEQVCLQPLQFSCWNGGSGRVDAFARKNQAIWDDALTAWQLSGVEDVTGKADLYHADYVKPRWDWSKTVRTVKVGRHIFLQEIR